MRRSCPIPGPPPQCFRPLPERVSTLSAPLFTHSFPRRPTNKVPDEDVFLEVVGAGQGFIRFTRSLDNLIGHHLSKIFRSRGLFPCAKRIPGHADTPLPDQTDDGASGMERRGHGSTSAPVDAPPCTCPKANHHPPLPKLPRGAQGLALY